MHTGSNKKDSRFYENFKGVLQREERRGACRRSLVEHRDTQET